MQKKVIIICGPTCSGKTAVAVSLAQLLSSEIISADSRQVYKYLNIGTAKPSIDVLQAVTHHLIDFLEPTEVYDASRFEIDALKIIANIHQAGKIPVVVGGTGLYIRALANGIFDIPSNEEIRTQLFSDLQEYGKEFLYNRLATLDPIAAATMLPQNWNRVIRALEVFLSTGNSIRELQQSYSRESDLEFLQFGLDWDREALYQMIDDRVDRMMQDGLIDEIILLSGKGFNGTLNALNTVGYKEVFSYLKNEISYEEAVRLIKRNTRHYAKRQLTWFRKDSGITWLHVEKNSDIPEIANKIYNLTITNV